MKTFTEIFPRQTESERLRDVYRKHKLAADEEERKRDQAQISGVLASLESAAKIGENSVYFDFMLRYGVIRYLRSEGFEVIYTGSGYPHVSFKV